jgi:hypothetical protein
MSSKLAFGAVNHLCKVSNHFGKNSVSSSCDIIVGLITDDQAKTQLRGSISCFRGLTLKSSRKVSPSFGTIYLRSKCSHSGGSKT